MAQKYKKSEEMSFEDCVNEVLKSSVSNYLKITRISYMVKNPDILKLIKIAEPHFYKRVDKPRVIDFFSDERDLDFFVETMRKLIKIENIDFEKLYLITQYDSICNDILVYFILKNHGLKENCHYLNDSERVKLIISGLFLEHFAILKLNFEEFTSKEKLLKYGFAINEYEKQKEKRLKNQKKMAEKSDNKSLEIYFEHCVKKVLEDDNQSSQFGKFTKIIELVQNTRIKKLCEIAKDFFVDNGDFDCFVETVLKLIKIENIDFDKLHLITQFDSNFNDLFVYFVLKKYGLEKNCHYLNDSERVKSIISGLFLEHLAILKLNFEEFSTWQKLKHYGYAINKYEKLKEKRLKDEKKSVDYKKLI